MGCEPFQGNGLQRGGTQRAALQEAVWRDRQRDGADGLPRIDQQTVSGVDGKVKVNGVKDFCFQRGDALLRGRRREIVMSELSSAASRALGADKYHTLPGRYWGVREKNVKREGGRRRARRKDALRPSLLIARMVLYSGSPLSVWIWKSSRCRQIGDPKIASRIRRDENWETMVKKTMVQILRAVF